MGRWITKNGVHVWIEDKGLYSAISEHYSKEKYENPNIDPYEYEKVTHEINNWCNIYSPKTKYRRGGIYAKDMFDSVYIFKIIDYNEYDIIDKFPIDDMKGKIK